MVVARWRRLLGESLEMTFICTPSCFTPCNQRPVCLCIAAWRKQGIEGAMMGLELMDGEGMADKEVDLQMTVQCLPGELCSLEGGVRIGGGYGRGCIPR